MIWFIGSCVLSLMTGWRNKAVTDSRAGVILQTTLITVLNVKTFNQYGRIQRLLFSLIHTTVKTFLKPSKLLSQEVHHFYRTGMAIVVFIKASTRPYPK